MFAQKINWGTLQEIDEVCVNRFGCNPEARDINWNKSRAFFLTHCDPVTMGDILNSALLYWTQDKRNPTPDKFFMSEISFRMLQYYTSTRFIGDQEHKLKMLDALKDAGNLVIVRPFETFRLTFMKEKPVGKKEVDVTPLPSGSCPGSLMFLFEQLWFDDTVIMRVLHTGNCRTSMDDIKSMAPLFDDKGNLKRLNGLYIDTSHFNHDTKELPSRRLAIDTCVRLMSPLLKKHGFGCRVDMYTNYAVSDLAFAREISYRFDLPIHVGCAMKRFCRDRQLAVHGVFTRKLQKFKAVDNFHLNCTCEDCCYPITADHSFKVDVHCNVGLNESKITNLQSSDTYKWNSENVAGYYRRGQDIAVVYSTNLSRFEAARMINFFACEKVKPLYVPNGMSLEELDALIKATLPMVNSTEPLDIKCDFPAVYFDSTCVMYHGFFPHAFCPDSDCHCWRNMYHFGDMKPEDYPCKIIPLPEKPEVVTPTPTQATDKT